jgi:hypothetical protein
MNPIKTYQFHYPDETVRTFTARNVQDACRQADEYGNKYFLLGWERTKKFNSTASMAHPSSL